MKINVLPKARADLQRIAVDIGSDNPDAADRLLKAAEETFLSIATNPEIGSQRSFRRLRGVRSRAIQGFRNYLIFYQHKSDEVRIVRVLHGVRDLPRFFPGRKRMKP